MALKKTASRAGRGPGRPFTKGRAKTGGRTKGRPNRVTVEAREFFRALISDPMYASSVRRRILAGRAPGLEVLAWHYFAGKPTERVEVTGGPRPLDLSKLTTEELIALRTLVRKARPDTDESGAAASAPR
jgi:hypothetical protein